MATGQRYVHFVGSTPHDTPEAAVAWMLDVGRDRLRSLPDGETEPERGNWAQYIFDSLAQLPELRLAAAGDWRTNTPPRLEVRRGQTLTPGRAGDALRYSRYAQANHPAVAGHGLPYQVGIPSDIVGASALRASVPPRPRHRAVFRQATALEIAAIRELTGGDVVFQLELPLETVMLTERVPGPIRPVVAGRLARGVAALVASTAPDTRFIAHLCEGDFNRVPHRSLGHPEDLGAAVALSNALVAAWPSTHPPLDRIHLPIGYGEHPPPVSRAYYRPLTRLRIPDSVRLVAGVAHETQTLARQRDARDLVEEHVGHRVDIAAPCGLGRHDIPAAHTVAERMFALTED